MHGDVFGVCNFQFTPLSIPVIATDIVIGFKIAER